MKRITLALLVFFALGITAQAQTTEKKAPKAKTSTTLTAKTDKEAVNAEKTAKITTEKTAASDQKSKKCCASMAEAKEKGCEESYISSSADQKSAKAENGKACAEKKSGKSCCAGKAVKANEKTEMKPEKDTKKDS